MALKQTFGQYLIGDRYETSPYVIEFMNDISYRQLCSVTYTSKQLDKFKDAINNSNFYEMFVEDLPMWGYLGDVITEEIILGELNGRRTFLFTHLHFKLGYNTKQSSLLFGSSGDDSNTFINRIVSAKVTTDVSLSTVTRVRVL